MRLIFLDGFWFVHISIFCMSKFNHLHNFLQITFPTQSFLVLFFIIIIYSLRVFHISVNWWSHWSLSDNKSRQVSRTLLSILVVLNNVVVWMVSIRPISKSSSPFNNPLVTIKSTNYNWYDCQIHVPQFFQFLRKVEELILLFIFFQFYFARFLFLLILIRFGLLAKIRWSVCMSKSHRSLCVSFSRTDAWLCIYHLFVWSNFNFLHNFQWITLPTQSCLVSYSICANLLHSLIMWLIVSSLSPHSLHLLFCCVLPILALIWLVLLKLFFAAFRRDSVSLLKFSFLSHVHVFSCEMLLFSRLKHP